MLKSLKRIVYFVEDPEKAKEWYNQLLGKQPVFDTPFAKIYNIGDCSLSLAKSPASSNEPCESMHVYWEVDDIDSVFEKMVSMGAQVKSPVKQVFNIRIAQLVDPFVNVIGLTGELKNTENRTVEKQPSETAQTVAFCRALAFKDNRQEVKGPDYLAELFLNDDAKKILQNEDSRKWAKENLVTSPLYSYFIARTSFIDSIFKSACEENIAQIVFLGAGYDTRAYRFRDQLKNAVVFEMDICPTQQRKTEILKANGIAIPDSLVFISINFKTDDIIESLIKVGYDSSKKTLFIWEGVTYYLTKEAVEKTITLIQKYSSNGSIVCFDYMSEKLESVNPAEPFKFWAAGQEIEELLYKNNIKINEHIDSSEMTRRYLTLKDGTIAENILTSFCFVKGVVKRS